MQVRGDGVTGLVTKTGVRLPYGYNLTSILFHCDP